MFIQLKTVTLLSNAALLSDAAFLNLDNLEYDDDNIKINSEKQKMLNYQIRS